MQITSFLSGALAQAGQSRILGLFHQNLGGSKQGQGEWKGER